jgi:phage replication O-like protein O
MPSPQLENGYTKIANEIMDALCHIRIAGEERQVLDVIIRKTYGWNKCEDAIALSQFVEMTGIKKPHVVNAINRLLYKNIISVTKNSNDGTNVYKLVKDYSLWEPLPKKVKIVTKNSNERY